MLIIKVLVFLITSFFARVEDTLSHYPHTRSVGACVLHRPALHTARLSTPRVEDTLLVISQEVSLIDTDPILRQESSMLLGKSLLAVMLFLLLDITYNHVFVAQAIAESGILSSPATKAWEVRICFQPLAAVCLHPLHERGQ